ncbi:MAG TPA: site-2 protease family protein [Bryobacterales bacterium]|nr:site-2 protease family protein [Bryobacterales bacterium]
MRASFTLGRILGIPIGVHSSWLVAFALIAWSLAAGYFPHQYPGWTVAMYWLVALFTTVLFFASVVIHELGHSVVARREKVDVLSITLFIFGGLAQIAREPPTAGAEFRIAIAGPITSFGLAAVLTLLGSLGTAGSVSSAPFVYLGWINFLLATFNMIPGFPLDGGRVLRAILWKFGGDFQAATRRASVVGRLVAFGFIFLGMWQILAGNFLNGLWIAFIGWFLNNAAESSYLQVALRDLLAGVQARDVMTQDCATVPGDMSLSRLVHDYILGTGRRCFLVGQGGSIQGLVTLHNIKGTPREQWADVTASQVMTPVESLQRARVDEDVLSLLQRMEQADVNQMPVLDDGDVKGMVSREHLLRYIRTRSELGV